MKDEYSYEKLIRVNTFEKIKAKYKKREYQEAKKDLEEFVKIYPDDDFGWYYLGKIMMHEKEYEKALQLFLESNIDENIMIKVDMIKCYMELSKYMDAYLLICEIRNTVTNQFTACFLRRAEIICLKNMNELNKLSFSTLGYIESQMINYDRELAINYSINTNFGKERFAKDISIRKTFIEMDKIVGNYEALPNSAKLTDTYLFDIPKIGVCGRKKLDVLKVTTIYKTSDIIAVYPVLDTKDYPSNMINDASKIRKKILKDRY